MFHVARTTIERHPQTLLGQLVTNEHTAEYRRIQHDLPVFVDAEPSLFPYIMQFYHHGLPIHVEASVNKEALLREFRYFGINIGKEAIRLPERPKGEVMQQLAKMVVEIIADGEEHDYCAVLREAGTYMGPEAADCAESIITNSRERLLLEDMIVSHFHKVLPPEESLWKDVRTTGIDSSGIGSTARVQIVDA